MEHEEKVPTIDYDDLQFGLKQGHGTFGVVYKGHLKSTEKVVAIKKITDYEHREVIIEEGIYHVNIMILCIIQYGLFPIGCSP